MTINHAELMNRQFPDVRVSYTRKDTLLYALAVGLGNDPLDEAQLPFVYEKNLQALPTMALVLGDAGFWLEEEDTGIDWPNVLYGGIEIVLHTPLQPENLVTGRTTVESASDKGEKGAVVRTRRVVTEDSTGALLSTIRSTYICRTDGGFGGPNIPTEKAKSLPTRPADHVCDLPTLRQMALLYRLTGDFNPLHVDPSIAREAGFNRPILHGLCTIGVAGHALLKTVCGYEAYRMRRLGARFTSPVFPGETIRTEVWRENKGMAGFRCRVVERDVIVVDAGHCEFVET